MQRHWRSLRSLSAFVHYVFILTFVIHVLLLYEEYVGYTAHTMLYSLYY